MLTGYMGRPTIQILFTMKTLCENDMAMRGRRKSSRATSIDMLIYPCLSVKPAFQQLRAIRPLGPDKTLTELRHFRLKGAPEPIYRRALATTIR